MKTVFIVNPAAGKGKKKDVLLKSLQKLGDRAEIYITKAPGDGKQYVRAYCKEHGAARFIACGGDGTFSEVVNGAMGTAQAEVGVIPLGTGNDFVRNFEDADFKNPELQISGGTVLCDVIKYRTETSGEIKEGFCANMFNIGFDCSVADCTADVKRKSVFSGSMAYFIAIILTLIRKRTYPFEIVADGEVVHSGDLLLTAVANGSYCGGGIKSNPTADIRDGNIQFHIIRNVSRLRFISLLPSYMKGTFLAKKGIESIIMSRKCKSLTVTPEEGAVRLCIDGEITDAGKTEFTVVPRAMRFVLPKEKTYES